MTKTNSSEEVEASWLLISKGEKKEKKKKKVVSVKHKGEEKNSKQDKTNLIGNSALAALWNRR